MSRIMVTCPNCSARLAVGIENAGKLLKCPKCQATVEVPVPDSDDVPPSEDTILWKVVVGSKRGGPFAKTKLLALLW